MKRAPELKQNHIFTDRKKSSLKTSHALVIGVIVASAIAFFTLGDNGESSTSKTSSQENSGDRYQIELKLPDYQEEELSQQDQSNQWQTFTVENGDSLAMIFDRAGLSATQLHKMLSQDKNMRKTLTRLTPGQQLQLHVNEAGDLQELVYKQNETNFIKAKREGEVYLFNHDERDYQRRSTYAQGVIDSSLFEAAQQAGLSESLTMDLAYIFGWDVDFALDIRKGDSFTVVYEELFLDDKKVGDGNILAAEFVNQGRSFKAVRYEDPNGNANYYTPEGRSMRKAFLRTPVDFARISSRFGKRHHPILNQERNHKGVDYAAPRGTPVKASGDGKIVFRGDKNGYGKTVVIDHGNGYSTLYAHLNNYVLKKRPGSRVKQGEVIGFVGSTGRATGPHLHYEFRVAGQHRNPLTVSLPKASPVNEKLREDFELNTRSWLAQLGLATNTTLAQLTSL